MEKQRKDRDRKTEKDKKKFRARHATYSMVYRLGGLGRFTYMCCMLYAAHFTFCAACIVLHTPVSVRSMLRVSRERRELPYGF